ncbi:LOW QUALITY PROTEIN: hypothetical protein HID58_007024 [Brassica napus]|uniref:Uncharacterized protein n=1 Tax=Brassica napus TaxID=3708 RepID=A0ABQ8EFM1_BRANA|nr:LOW QUALITY PROTEIN: hypothetical protein HID58_007024 [Brassica napus]
MKRNGFISQSVGPCQTLNKRISPLKCSFKRQSGANHIIRGLRNASPAPIKATIETIPCSIKYYPIHLSPIYGLPKAESNPVIPPSGKTPTPFKSTSSSDDLTELKKPKATENEPYQIFLCESISKKEIAVKKSANCLQFGVIQNLNCDLICQDAANIVLNKPHGMAVQLVRTDRLLLLLREELGCTDLTETVVDFWCWEEHKRLQRLFIVYSSRKQLVSVAYVKPLQHAITEYRVIEFSPLVSQIPSFYFDDKFLLPTQMELNILLYASSSLNEQGLHRVMACHRTCDGSMNRDYTVLFPLVSQGVLKYQSQNSSGNQHRRKSCVTCVSYLSSKVGSITEAPDGLRFISCEKTPLFRAVRTFPDLCGKCLPLFLLEKLLPYEVGRRRVSLFKLHMARGGVEDSPYDPEQMVCMNYGEYANQKSVVPCQKNLAFGAAASMVGCSE